MEVSPNPTNGRAWLNVQLTDEQQLSVALFDCLGRRIQILQTNNRQPAGDWTLPLDLSGLSAGVYLVQVSTGDGSADNEGGEAVKQWPETSFIILAA